MTENTFEQVPMGAERRTVNELRYETNGGASSLLVRQTGAAIRELRLGNVEVLTTGTELDPNGIEQPLKIDAAHTMLPVGPSELGPQHGVSRYSDYEVEHSTEKSVSLRSWDRLRNLGHFKDIDLDDDLVIITDTIENLALTDTQISAGEHLYFKVPEAELERIRLVEEDGSDAVIRGHNEDGSIFEGTYADMVGKIREGDTVYGENFTGSQLIEIPGVGQVRLLAEAAKSSGDSLQVDFHIWHRPGSNTVCFEPVVGFSVDEEGDHNDGIKLGPDENLQLRSEIQLLTSHK